MKKGIDTALANAARAAVRGASCMWGEAIKKEEAHTRVFFTKDLESLIFSLKRYEK